MPAVWLALPALTVVAGLRGKLLSVALLFCAAGDAALAYGDGDHRTIGLALSLAAQILFIVTCNRDFKMQKARIPGAVFLVAYAALMALILRPSLEDMALPVYIYLTVITIMGVTARINITRPFPRCEPNVSLW